MTPAEISRRTLLLSSAAALGCGRPKASRFHGYCFVANETGRSVGVVDLTRFRLRKQIPLDAVPSQVLAHPSKPKVYVLAPAAGMVYEIDAGALSMARSARVGNQAASMQISPANDALWVLSKDPAALVEVPFESMRPNRRIRLSTPADDFDLSQDRRAAIVSRQDHSIVLASLDHADIERTVIADDEPSLVRFHWTGKQVLVGSQAERSLGIFDVPTGRVVVRLPLPLAPRHFCFTNDHQGQLFISGDGMDAIVIVFPYTTEVDQTILAGHAPEAMAVTSKQPPYLLVANPDSNGITVLDVDTRKLVAVVQVGQEPRQILMTPDEEYALVLNQKSGDLAVIRILSLAFAPDGSRRRFKSAPLFTLIPVGEKPVSAAVVDLG
ncbi:MAG TPA: beta-propeller fold lactonase family protein [Bryobacteraceae bacterium]